MTNINFTFIETLEGGKTCSGYVPDAQNSRSGVTIATGFDIGQRTPEQLYRLLPRQLAFKLASYCEKTGEKAAAFLASKPLNISESDANTINICYKKTFINSLVQSYNKASNKPFNQLPEQAQTVIASVAFQYGNLAKRCPKFWQTAVTQNWANMGKELENFGDRYPSRRKQEAAYLKGINHNTQKGIAA